jgi:hypothetical protein
MGTLSSTIEGLISRGFTAHFGVVGGRLRAFDSGKTFGADQLGGGQEMLFDNPRFQFVARQHEEGQRPL